MKGNRIRRDPDTAALGAVGLVVVALVVIAAGVVVVPMVLEPAPEPGVCLDLANTSQEVATEFERWYDRHVGDVRKLAGEVEGASRESMEATLNDWFEGSPRAAVSANVVDLEAKEVLASSRGHEGQNFTVTLRDWTQAVDSIDVPDGPRIVDTHRTSRSLAVVVFVAPVEGQRAVVYLVNVTSFDVELPREGQVAYVANLTGEERSVIFDSSGEALFSRYPSYGDVVAAARSLKAGTHGSRPKVLPARGTTGYLEYSVKGEHIDDQTIPSYADVPGTPYTVIVHTPKPVVNGATCEDPGGSADRSKK